MKVVGVTSCSAGLAHTPMAAKGLTDAGKALGVDVKIEQQGIMGQVDTLTQKDIDEANFVIISAMQKIAGEDRFKNKLVMKVDINTTVKAPELVLKKCIKAYESKCS